MDGIINSLLLRCPEASSYCATIVQYTPNLQVGKEGNYLLYEIFSCYQDDSDANYNDDAGRVIRLDKTCEKVECGLKKVVLIQGHDKCLGITDIATKHQACPLTRAGK